MILRNLRIGTRLALGFGAVLAILLVVSVGGTALAKKNRDELAKVVQVATAKEELAAEMKAHLLEQSAGMRNIGLHSEIKEMQVEEDRARGFGKRYDEARARLGALASSEEEKKVLAAVDAVDKQIEGPFLQALGLSTSFQNEAAAKVILGELDPAIQKVLSELNRLVELQKKSNTEAIEQAIANGDRLAMATYVVEGIVLAIAIFLAWATTRSIVVPLGESVEVARRVASGDLTSRVEVNGRDEAAALLSALRDMNLGLGRMVTQIRTGAESIAVGANQVAAGNQQLSSRTEEHASSLEETASTLEEFTTTVRQNAEHAKQASALAGSASATAIKGGEVVGQVVATMQEVSTSSKKISEIIAVIDGISFQTNILALNAAVEAARAGEQGRGFAVVASEVRSLAQRSAASAKEIRGLIEESVGRIDAGARLVEQAGRTMNELVESVRKVAQIMTEIAAASHEQSSGIEQINKAITQMDNVVQMNASLVEEATAAATSMAGQATGLARAVAAFRVEGDGAGAHLPAAPAAPRAPSRPMAAVEERRAAPVPARREPALAAAEEDWKEF